MPSSYQRPNERRRKDERNRQVMEMWKRGLNSREISMALEERGERISRQRVDQIIRRGMEEAREARVEHAAGIFDGELERLTTIIREAWAIVTSRCRTCRGTGSVETIEGVGATEVPCEWCAGTGHTHRADTRVRAMKEARNAIDQRAKMLGLYAPEKFALTDTSGNDVSIALREELAAMPADDLDRALTDYMAGIEAARSLDAATGR